MTNIEYAVASALLVSMVFGTLVTLADAWLGRSKRRDGRGEMTKFVAFKGKMTGRTVYVAAARVETVCTNDAGVTEIHCGEEGAWMVCESAAEAARKLEDALHGIHQASCVPGGEA